MVVQMLSVGEDTGALDEMLTQDQRVLRPGGRGHHRGPHLADRAAHDRRHGRGDRRDDHRPVHADLQGLRPDPVTHRRWPCSPRSRLPGPLVSQSARHGGQPMGGIVEHRYEGSVRRWVHPDRAAGRDHHHRDPGRDRHPRLPATSGEGRGTLRSRATCATRQPPRRRTLPAARPGTTPPTVAQLTSIGFRPSPESNYFGGSLRDDDRHIAGGSYCLTARSRSGQYLGYQQRSRIRCESRLPIDAATCT